MLCKHAVGLARANPQVHVPDGKRDVSSGARLGDGAETFAEAEFAIRESHQGYTGRQQADPLLSSALGDLLAQVLEPMDRKGQDVTDLERGLENMHPPVMQRRGIAVRWRGTVPTGRRVIR